MARTLLGEVELRLRDRLTPGAKSAAEALRSVKSAADALGTGTRLNVLTGSLVELARLGKEVRGAFAGLHIPAEVQAGLRQMNVAGRGLPRLSAEATGAAGALKGLKASIAGGLGAERFRADVNGITGDLRRLASAGRGLSSLATSTARAAAPLEHLRTTLAGVRAEAAAPIRLNLQYDRSFTRRIAADLEGVRSQARRPITIPAPRSAPVAPAPVVAHPHRGGAPGIVGAYAGGATANQAVRGGRYAVIQGAESAREDTRIASQGATPQEAAQIADIARRLSSVPAYRSLDQLQIREMARNLLANVGDYGKTLEVLPEYVRGRVALQNIVGPRNDDREMEYFSRFIDLAGRSRDPDATKRLIDDYIRARQLDSRAVTAQDYVNFMQTGGSTARGFNNDFLGRVVPALIAQQRGHRTGTDLTTAFNNFVLGRGTNASLEEQMAFFRDESSPQVEAQNRFGLREGVQRAPGRGGRPGRITNKGSIVDEAGYIANPYEWAKRHLVPAFVRDGILPEGYGRGDYSQDLTPEQRGRLTRSLGDLFSARRGASIFSLMLGDMGQIEAFLGRRDKASGTGNVEQNARQDPFMQWEAVMAQTRNALQDMSKPILTSVLPALERFAAGLNAVSNFIGRNPEWAPHLAGATALGATGAALGGSWLAMRGIGSALGLGGGGAAGGSVLGAGGALASILRILPIAGTVLGVGSIAGVPIGKTFAGVEPGEQHNFGRRIRRGAEAMARKGRDERFGPLATPEEQGPPAPPQLDPLHGRMVQRRDEVQRQIDALRAGGEPAAGSPAAQTLSNLNAELAALGARIAEAEAAVRNAGQSLGSAAAQGVQGTTGEASAAGASVGLAIMEGLRSALGNIGGPGSAPPREGASPPGRALGGPVSAGQLYTVGEAGTELFQPGANGSIIPNHALGRLGGRSPRVSVNLGGITINGGDAEAIMAKINDRITEALTGAFSDGEMTWG